MTFDINVTVNDTRCAASLAKRAPITTGCRGEFRVVLYQDESWAAMDKTVVFRAGRVERSQHIGLETSCMVPPEVLLSTASMLEIGVYGTSGADVVRSTVWARVSGILPGARPTDDPTESPDLYAQLIAQLNTTVKTVNGQGPDENGNVDVEIPTIDRTMTQSGQAADAAAVGSAISSLSEEKSAETDTKISAHNTGTDTHSDIRLMISGLTDRLNALADSDDTTLDQLSEVVAYIKANRNLISSITTDKVSVSDIIDNLTTNVTDKPLSAAQGVALKALIDEINVPTATIADNGKVLSVVDGAPYWTITSAEQAATSAANAEKSATIAQECAQAMAGTFDFTGYLRYQIVDAAPETYEEGVLYIVASS